MKAHLLLDMSDSEYMLRLEALLYKMGQGPLPMKIAEPFPQNSYPFEWKPLDHPHVDYPLSGGHIQ